MPFNSLSYFLFLPVVFLLHYFTPDRFRWLVLLAASFVFYAALKSSHLIAVLLFITTITYCTGIWIDRKKDPRTKQYLLWGGISANILTLIILKYLPFITQNLNVVLSRISSGTTVPVSKAIIAIGVSYFIFQAISYLVDIYLEIEQPEHHFGRFALYMAFFPKLMQGPIERAGDLLPQLNKQYQFDYDAMRFGMLLFTWGLFKKAVVADRLALYADQVFNNVNDYSGLSLIIGIYAYALQIYFDFSAYTDMARGTGRMFGINLTENFNSPYLATSIADFWRRWHISFSRWILDYIFKPLQMSWRDWGHAGTAAALIITFLISGIWHGATWGFVLWGLLHGIYLASSTYYRPYQRQLHKWLGVEKSKWLKWWQVFVTFNLVSFAWIFFRVKHWKDAWVLLKNLANIDIMQRLKEVGTEAYISKYILLNIPWGKAVILFIVVIPVIVVHCMKVRNVSICNQPKLVRLLIYLTLLISLSLFSYAEQYTFIYNQF
jgi:D-alanyl-lipoteichoic acid acyltransferase DltB (MBOAT superfamily)